MKKLLMLLTLVFLISGCQKASDLLIPEPSVTPMPTIDATFETGKDKKEPNNEIYMSQVIHMNGDWTTMGSVRYAVTDDYKKSRIILATSAKTKDGEVMWDDSQYWTLAVVTQEGVYNLFHNRISGYVYMEVNEAFVRGLSTPIITAYMIGNNEREIRHYIFDEDHFEEYIEYTSDDYSTGGINNIYSTIPEPERDN